jgi:hypothetical protein
MARTIRGPIESYTNIGSYFPTDALGGWEEENNGVGMVALFKLLGNGIDNLMPVSLNKVFIKMVGKNES